MNQTKLPQPGLQAKTGAQKWLVLLLAGASTLASPISQAQPVATLDLAAVGTTDSGLQRIYGSVGDGVSGVPVAGGEDMDGDGHVDYALAAMRASPLGRNEAGQVFLVFGDGQVNGDIDTGTAHPRVLPVLGDQVNENTGSEMWMADVTGDGLGDLLICRQNHNPDSSRIGAGALTILVGDPILETMAASGQTLDLRNPPGGVPIVNILGANAGLEDGSGINQEVGERLCIWARTGDMTGDGIDDFLVGADRRASQQNPTEEDSGAAYVFRGGNHFASGQTIDLNNFGSVAVGNVLRLRPPADCDDDLGTGINCHFGATVQVADMDGNGSAEAIIATALNRAGASLPPAGGSGNGGGGSRLGSVYVAWDDNFAGNWNPSPDFHVGPGAGGSPGTHTILHGGAGNHVFGEEILGGRDYDNDGNADLFVGDLTGEGFGGLPAVANAGLGHVIYNVANWKNQSLHIDAPPPGFEMATFQGPEAGAIAADTAMHGDYNNDGIDDLAFSSPHDNPIGRINAGTIHILLGKNGQWPAESNLDPADYPDSADVQFVEIYGANGGGGGGDAGDTLSYSAAEGDINGDGVIEIITNEMQGNSPTVVDVGNLILMDVRKLFDFDSFYRNGFEDPE